jgi:hypothetical protein
MSDTLTAFVVWFHHDLANSTDGFFFFCHFPDDHGP